MPPPPWHQQASCYGNIKFSLIPEDVPTSSATPQSKGTLAGRAEAQGPNGWRPRGLRPGAHHSASLGPASSSRKGTSATWLSGARQGLSKEHTWKCLPGEALAR